MPITQDRLFDLVEASKDLLQASHAVFTRIKDMVENESDIDQLVSLRGLAMSTIYDYLKHPHETELVITRETERIRLTRGYNKRRLARAHRLPDVEKEEGSSL